MMIAKMVMVMTKMTILSALPSQVSLSSYTGSLFVPMNIGSQCRKAPDLRIWRSFRGLDVIFPVQWILTWTPNPFLHLLVTVRIPISSPNPVSSHLVKRIHNDGIYMMEQSSQKSFHLWYSGKAWQCGQRWRWNTSAESFLPGRLPVTSAECVLDGLLGVSLSRSYQAVKLSFYPEKSSQVFANIRKSAAFDRVFPRSQCILGPSYSRMDSIVAPYEGENLCFCSRKVLHGCLYFKDWKNKNLSFYI